MACGDAGMTILPTYPPPPATCHSQYPTCDLPPTTYDLRVRDPEARSVLKASSSHLKLPITEAGECARPA